MRPLILATVFLGSMLVFGCAPATTYNRGIDISFHPSGKADAQERLVSSAVELKSEGDTKLLKDAGGIYLGELEVVGKKAGGMFMGQSGGNTLSGRISLEAASRGATHFYLASSDVESHLEMHQTASGDTSATPTSKTHARYTLFRIEEVSWAKLPPPYRPEAMPSAQAPAAPASSTPTVAGDQKL